MDPSTISECCTTRCAAIAIGILAFLIIVKKYFSGGVFKPSGDIDLTGKTAIVTGGNSGIGAETAKYFARKGCSVIIGARDQRTAQEVIKQCRKENPSCNVESIPLDLSDRKSIQSFSNSVKFEKIDFLINNAGVMAIPRRKLTKEGNQMQWGVNHLGHFYLTYLLWDKVKKSSSFKVVNVSSLAHKAVYVFTGQPTLDFDNINYQKNYNQTMAYGRSKLYNVLFTRALASKISPDHGTITSLHPGVVRTELLREIKSEGPGRILGVLMFFVYPLYWLLTKSSWQGCQTTLYAALSPQAENGCYYADCRKDSQNPLVTKQNWQKLWQISEKFLSIKFKV